MYTHTREYINVYAYIYTDIHIYIYIHIHMHLCTYWSGAMVAHAGLMVVACRARRCG